MVTRWDPFWDPYRGALSLRDAMNRLFEQAVLQPAGEAARPDPARSSEGNVFAPALDVHETQDAYTVKASLPGVKPDDLNIQYQRGVLSISGSMTEEQTQSQGTYHLRERRHGRFGRTISLPDAVDAEHALATYEHGILELRLPKAEETKPRRIQVQPAAPVSVTAAAASEIGNGSVAPSGNGLKEGVGAGA